MILKNNFGGNNADNNEKNSNKKQIQNIIIVAEKKNYTPHIISGKNKISIAILYNNNE